VAALIEASSLPGSRLPHDSSMVSVMMITQM
jgi:hypothetical protein